MDLDGHGLCNYQSPDQKKLPEIAADTGIGLHGHQFQNGRRKRRRESSEREREYIFVHDVCVCVWFWGEEGLPQEIEIGGFGLHT